MPIKRKRKKKERNLLFSPFKSGKGPLFHEVGRNNSRKCFRDEIILATFMQIEDAGMKELCSSMREGRNSPTVQAGLFSPTTPWRVSVTCAEDRSNGHSETGNEIIPWTQTDHHLNGMERRKRSFIKEFSEAFFF